MTFISQGKRNERNCATRAFLSLTP
jgi:hypothetical protein